jgi:RHS repeat-associated protein
VTHYYYLDDGSLDSIRNANGTTTKYQYDAAGRLIRLVNRKSDGSIINSYNYTLDNLGNHISVTQNEPISQPAITAIDETYSYDNANRIIHAGSTTFGFDNNGNMTSKNENGVLNYSWDTENRLTGFTGQSSASFVYDGSGNRRAATRNGVTTRYVLDVSGSMSNVLIETDAAGNRLYYYIYGLGLISKIKASDNFTYYYHYDSRGSTIAMTDQSQNITHKYAYDAFGKVLEKEEPISDFNPFRYVGKYGVMYEDSTLYFMRARFYNPKIGRFLSEDPIWALNLFSYVENNPATFIDPNGLAVFALTKIPGLGKFDNLIGEIANINIGHEHIFFNDGSNIGWGDKGLYIEKSPQDYSVISLRNFNDVVLKWAVLDFAKENRNRKFSLLGLEKDREKFNCQDFADDIRRRYKTLNTIYNSGNLNKSKLDSYINQQFNSLIDSLN